MSNMDSILKHVSGIKVRGGNFENEKSLGFFEKNKRICLLYGKNGSGKSTIGKAFLKIKNTTGDFIKSAELIDYDGEIIRDTTSNGLESIYVYNEAFVDDNIRLQEDGLDTIVMLGEQREWDDKIKTEEIQLKKYKEEYDEQERICLRYEGDEGDVSPKKLLKRIGEVLRADNGWAERDAYIRDKKQKSRVNDTTYTQFIERTPQKDRDALLLEYAKKKDAYEIAKTGAGRIATQFDINEEINIDVEKIARLLSKKIEKPEFSEREKYLLSLIKAEGQEHISVIKENMKDENSSVCKYCLQPISDEHKSNVLDSISAVLNKVSEEHIDALEGCKIAPLKFDFSPFGELESEAVRSRKALDRYNRISLEINTELDKKIKDVYTPIDYKNGDVNECVEEVKNAFQDLKIARDVFNSNVTDSEKIKLELINLNDDIAYWDVIELSNEYDERIKEKSLENSTLQSIQTKIDNTDKLIKEYEMKKRSVNIALDQINEGLRYVFFSNERFSIVYNDEKYKLYSNGKSVLPCDISVGERNIIALCYFFANMMKNKDKESRYSDGRIIIIDDPVSSFDMENRVGIMSYLKFQLSRFLLGNISTKLLFMTHDLQTYYDAEKMFKEITTACNKKYQNLGKHQIRNRELLNGDIIDKRSDKQEYTALLKMVYNFASSETSEYELIIGNVMRRTLEAFSTFQYRMSIEEISNNADVLDLLERPFNKYYENLMYRLVLNGESHLQDRVKTMSDMNFYEVIGYEQKKRTARDIICLIYLLNKQHLVSHLDTSDNLESDVEKWLEDIKACCL